MRFRSLLRDRIGDFLHLTRVTDPGRCHIDKLSIATFHRVLPTQLRFQYPFPGLVVTPEELQWLLRFFKRHFSCGTLRDVMVNTGKIENGKPLLAITFDDAQADNADYAQAVLEEEGVRATFFVPSENVEKGEPLWHDRVGFSLQRLTLGNKGFAEEMVMELGVNIAFLDQRSDLSPEGMRSVMAALKSLPDRARKEWVRKLEVKIVQPVVPDWAGMMTWDQLSGLARAGHEIGSHSVSHPILPNCDEEEIGKEVAHSKRDIEAKLGSAVDSFCYPNGSWDERVVKAVREAGYQRAVTTQWGSNPSESTSYTLRRYDISSEHLRDSAQGLSESRLAWRISGFYPGLG